MARWIEFETIKRAVALTAVFAHYQIGDLRRSGKNHLRGRCPLHRGEGRESFHADTAEQIFHCFACGVGGSVLDLVAAIERCSLRHAAEKLSAWRGPLDDYVGVRQPTVTKKIESVAPLRFRLRGVDVRHPYLNSRGISETTAVEFGIGFYSGPGVMQNRLVIPIDDEAGRLVGYCGRSLDGHEPRYKFPGGFAKSQVLFNLHRALLARQPTAIVVEGFFDCLKVHQAGFRSVVALMGSALSERQRRLLVEHFRSITLMLDGDQTGRRANRTISATLAQDRPVRIVRLDENLQPDQLSPEFLREILAGKGVQSQND